jgi:hypothetical protein
MDDAWVVWSFERQMWWRSNWHGYTSELLLAGVYSEADAKAIEADANKHSRERKEAAKPLAQAIAEHDVKYMPRGTRVIDVLAGRTV